MTFYLHIVDKERLILGFNLILLVASWSCLHSFWDSWKSCRSFCISLSLSLSFVCSTTTCVSSQHLSFVYQPADSLWSQIKSLKRVCLTNLFLVYLIILMKFLFLIFNSQQVFFDWKINKSIKCFILLLLFMLHVKIIRFWVTAVESILNYK